MERSPELEALARGLYEAVSTADPAWFERHLSRGPSCVVIGTEPAEWWDERGPALAAIREQMKSVGTDLALQAGDLRGWHHGDVGWVSDRPVVRWKGAESPCRHTSVFAREEGEWRLVQHHFSIGVANEAVFGR